MTAETPRITALTPAQAAKLLAAAGNRRITEAMVRADIEADGLKAAQQAFCELKWSV